ncbi:MULTISPECIES: hypothetical protein [unclassified Aeromicrobium]|uniref:hypothetical protein n=1 Tax=unclassified Aeromicrobium TaxID=2633570 RepID=UPI00396AF788
MSDIGRSVVPPLHRAWDPDESLDFHAARILVLLRICGEGARGSIEGRTKLAKLDFFVRYPLFLARAHEEMRATDPNLAMWEPRDHEVEAPMIRYRYGPWDPRYRQFLAFLRARNLIRITNARIEKVALTAAGVKAAEELLRRPSFAPIAERCSTMRDSLCQLNGTELKDLVYDLFPTEVGELRHWNEINQ